MKERLSREAIAMRIAREFFDGAVVNLGIGLGGAICAAVLVGPGNTILVYRSTVGTIVMQTTLYPPRSAARLRRTSLDLFGLLLLLAAFLLIALGSAWQFWHTARIYTGVSVGGVPVGGLTRAAAMKLLNEQLYAYPLPPVSVEYGGQQWPLQTAQVQASWGAPSPRR